MGGVIIRISNLTFGIYLIHGLVLHLLDYSPVIHYFNNWLIGLIAFLLSLMVAVLLSLLPFKKWLIG